MYSDVRLLIKTCHRRGVHAMGGMSAFIPLKDPAANAAVTEKVFRDKMREVNAGHDGTAQTLQHARLHVLCYFS